MLDAPNRDRRAERRSATQAEILEAAWGLCAANGLASLSLRDLARQIGLKAPSLYSYFESKNAIYDAMFAQGCQQLLDERPAHIPSDLLDGIRAIMRYFVSFCVADPGPVSIALPADHSRVRAVSGDIRHLTERHAPYPSTGSPSTAWTDPRLSTCSPRSAPALPPNRTPTNPVAIGGPDSSTTPP